jgi:hypothetical protein
LKVKIHLKKGQKVFNTKEKKLKDEIFLKKLFDIIIKSNLIDQPWNLST